MPHIRHLVDAAGQAITTANRRTIEPGHLTAQDTYITVGELTYLTNALDQLCRQLDHNLHQRVEVNDLRHDTNGDPNDTALNAATSLRLAARQLHSATQLLDQAHQNLSHLADLGPLIGDPGQGNQP